MKSLSQSEATSVLPSPGWPSCKDHSLYAESFQAYANQQLDMAGGTFVMQSLKGQEGRELLIPKQHWAAVKPQIRSVKIQRPPTPGMGFCDILFLAMVCAGIFMAGVIIGIQLRGPYKYDVVGSIRIQVIQIECYLEEH
ncbi:uncharacterized protein BT62DRAFT_997300 [Guyanagaster necrorhizus]|uniref:Uncharacterized protein n=1 Tax=Guyanagaster necrorhizus TaxID=856835 RepID=A0A9P8AMH9_9AGAR|nr:uncharacterized protein BT62DRAFT_997300 [Guyanagaster necrorhizus MCA 3950]KAG7441273.1 hypothetical protein BT62DRAFT_997300 [Guyanagaster necrorhizus MCA 3950]